MSTETGVSFCVRMRSQSSMHDGCALEARSVQIKLRSGMQYGHKIKIITKEHHSTASCIDTIGVFSSAEVIVNTFTKDLLRGISPCGPGTETQSLHVNF